MSLCMYTYEFMYLSIYEYISSSISCIRVYVKGDCGSLRQSKLSEVFLTVHFVSILLYYIACFTWKCMDIDTYVIHGQFEQVLFNA
jgi:hypothetical protein